MGKLRYDPNCYPHIKESNTALKMMHKTPKKMMKITYISSPVLVKACDASEFRSVVQQLTGKDSNNNDNNNNNNNKVRISPQKGYNNSSLMHQSVMQSGDVLRANEDHGNVLMCHYDNRSLMSSLDEFDEDYYFWKELARSVLPSTCVLV